MFSNTVFSRAWHAVLDLSGGISDEDPSVGEIIPSFDRKLEKFRKALRKIERASEMPECDEMCDVLLDKIEDKLLTVVDAVSNSNKPFTIEEGWKVLDFVSSIHRILDEIDPYINDGEDDFPGAIDPRQGCFNLEIEVLEKLGAAFGQLPDQEFYQKLRACQIPDVLDQILREYVGLGGRNNCDTLEQKMA